MDRRRKDAASESSRWSSSAFTRVLLVDGVDAMRDFHRHLLRNAGFHNVFEASTSVDGLDAFRRQRFGLVVWAIARDPAFDELLLVNAKTPYDRVPMMVLVGHGDTTTFANHEYVVLEKPVSVETLRRTVHGLSRGHIAVDGAGYIEPDA